MKKTYRLALLAGIGLLGLGLTSNAYAFHDGGVAHCDGCHTMHNSSDGKVMAVGGAGSIGNGVSSFLTKGSDPSSTCLNCHEGSGGATTAYHVYTADGTGYNAGGDFYWLTVNVPMERGTSVAANHGHNVIAADYGLVQDPNLTSGPSNGTVTYQVGWLGCNSCHDPHGKKDNNSNPKPIAGSGSYGNANPDPGNVVMGNFRLLGGIGYDGGAQATGISFTYGDPVAVGYSMDHTGMTPESNTKHVDYGSGISEWCTNCHSGFTADGSGAHRHPAGNSAFADKFAASYNSYKTTGDMTGIASSAFEHLVPFQRGVYDTDNDGVPNAVGTGPNQLGTGNTNGMNNMSGVMCLTCHRAHATPFDNMGRWNFGATFLIEEEANAEAAGFTLKQLYGGDDMTRFNAYQRSLCNKCHVQD